MQPSEQITYLGPKASYTHQAALKAFGSDADRYTLVPQTTIEDVFTTVQAGRATHGIVPFENSTNGSVVFTLDLFADQHAKHPDIAVCGEVYIPVHHCLLGRLPAETMTAHDAPSAHHSSSINSNLLNIIDGNHAHGHGHGHSPSSSGHATPTALLPHPQTPRAAPLAPLAHITKLYSHPQAWGQCRAFLAAYCKGVERCDVASTSRAAELAAADASGASAALSSAIAARMNGLQFLARDVEDRGDNCTRFFVLRRRLGDDDAGDADDADDAGIHHDDDDDDDDDAAGHYARHKSLVSLSVSHADPGALADALAAFKAHGLNLTSINARPSGEAPWHYIFFLEFQGRRGQRRVDAALGRLESVATSWRWLGSWENALPGEGGGGGAPCAT